MQVNEIRNRVNYTEDQFEGYIEDYNSLLETLEAESRGLIDSYLGDESFEEETGRVDEIIATDDSALTLIYPVQDVISVEYKRTFGSEWVTLPENRYDFSKHKLILSSYPYRNRRIPGVGAGRSRIARNTLRTTWSQFCSKVKVTYDRGFATIPDNILNIQATLINKMLRQLRQEQNLSAIQPDNVQNFVDFDDLMTEDIMRRLDEITSMGNFVRSV